MKGRSKLIIVIFFVIIIAGSVLIAINLGVFDDDSSNKNQNLDDDSSNEITFQDTIGDNEQPQLELPVATYNNITNIQGFGELPSGYNHNGIDFRVNASTEILTPYHSYVSDVRTFYNDDGGHWQTNVQLRLSDDWYISLKFESWAASETNGSNQNDSIYVSVGDELQTNESIGTLLSFGEYSHIHFDVDNNGTYLCPYNLFTSSAKSKFDELYAKYGYPADSPCN